MVSFREASCSLLPAILPPLKRFYFGIVQLLLEVSKGLVKTSTDWTASIGRLIADSPVKGSVAFAPLTIIPLWLERSPFRLIKPSGPLTPPGTSGMAS